MARFIIAVFPVHWVWFLPPDSTGIVRYFTYPSVEFLHFLTLTLSVTFYFSLIHHLHAAFVCIHYCISLYYDSHWHHTIFVILFPYYCNFRSFIVEISYIYSIMLREQLDCSGRQKCYDVIMTYIVIAVNRYFVLLKILHVQCYLLRLRRVFCRVVTVAFQLTTSCLSPPFAQLAGRCCAVVRASRFVIM